MIYRTGGERTNHNATETVSLIEGESIKMIFCAYKYIFY